MNKNLKGLCAIVLSLTLLTTTLTACGKKIQRGDNSAAGQQYIDTQNGGSIPADNNAGVPADGNISDGSVNNGGGYVNSSGGNSAGGFQTGGSQSVTPVTPSADNSDSSSQGDLTSGVSDNTNTTTTTGKSSIFDRLRDRTSRTTTTSTTTEPTSRTTRPVTSNPVNAQRVLNAAPLNPMITNDPTLDSMVDNLITNLTNSGMTTYQKVCAIYDHFVINYRYGYMPLRSVESAYISLYDADVVGRAKNFLTYKTGVCIDFSAAFMAVMRRLGLECYLITGQIVNKYGDDSFHGWSVMRINGTDYGFDPEADFRYSNGDPARYYNFCVDDPVKFNPAYTNMASAAFKKFRTL